jgi:hypothetical protein
MNKDQATWLQAIEHGLMTLHAVFYKVASADALRGYVFALRNLSVEEFRNAVDRAQRECTTFPPPAVLIELSKPKPSVLSQRERQERLLSEIKGDCEKIPMLTGIPNPSPYTGKLSDMFRGLPYKGLPEE